MIIVYHFLGGSCGQRFIDSTNGFGHAAIAFTGLGDKSFAISQMKDGKTNPTYHNHRAFLERAKDQTTVRDHKYPNFDWRTKLLDRAGHSFDTVYDRAYIISNEDLASIGKPPPPKKGLVEGLAFDWWNGLIKETDCMGEALSPADCTDTVYRAISQCIRNEDKSVYAWQRNVGRFMMMPSSAVAYARAINSAVIKDAGLTKADVRGIRRADILWRMKTGRYDHLAEYKCDSEDESTPLLADGNTPPYSYGTG